MWALPAPPPCGRGLSCKKKKKKKKYTEMEEQPSKKAKMEENFSLKFDFCNTDTLDSRLSWKNPPATFSLENGSGLKICPKPKTDFWRKTFLTPPADRASGHALLYNVPEGLAKCHVQTDFTLKDKVQYDQAGLMIYIDDQHWLKAGIEVEGGVVNMSCVATNRESDWSYKTWPTSENVRIKAEITMYDGVVECLVEHANQDGNEWSFLREAPITVPSGGEVRVGVMCCAPTLEEGASEEEAMEVIFKYLTVTGEYQVQLD